MVSGARFCLFWCFSPLDRTTSERTLYSLTQRTLLGAIKPLIDHPIYYGVQSSFGKAGEAGALLLSPNLSLVARAVQNP